MSTAVIVYVLTGLGAVVVVLTRWRLRASARGAGRLEIARGPVAVHTFVGALALLSWTTFLAADGVLSENAATLLGLGALVCWWITVVAGLLILMRWLPVRGKHASPGSGDPWSEGPALSVLAHVGLLVGVVVFTYAYLVKAV
ncbi:hypothetical protein BH09ACT12_BH09ACT12_13240 [soil metagenome]